MKGKVAKFLRELTVGLVAVLLLSSSSLAFEVEFPQPNIVITDYPFKFKIKMNDNDVPLTVKIYDSKGKILFSETETFSFVEMPIGNLSYHKDKLILHITNRNGKSTKIPFYFHPDAVINADLKERCATTKEALNIAVINTKKAYLITENQVTSFKDKISLPLKIGVNRVSVVAFGKNGKVKTTLFTIVRLTPEMIKKAGNIKRGAVENLIKARVGEIIVLPTFTSRSMFPGFIRFKEEEARANFAVFEYLPLDYTYCHVLIPQKRGTYTVQIWAKVANPFFETRGKDSLLATVKITVE